jgi:hypothetical protein
MKSRNVTVSIDDDTWHLLRATAVDHGVSLSALLRRWIKGGVELHVARTLNVRPQLRLVGAPPRTPEPVGPELRRAK